MFRNLNSRSAPATSHRRPLLKRLMPAALLALLLLTSSAASPPPVSGSAALIYAGWFGNTTPTPSFINANLAFLESQPFDGLVVYLRDPGLSVNVTAQVMTTNPLSYESALWVMSPLVGLNFTHLTQNLGMILGNSPPDFFDDWSITIQNFANVARAAKDSGLKGLCFDNEQYFSPWGDYGSHLRYFSTKTFAEYQAQARLRGKQVMEAMVAQFPDIAVITLHGPYVSEPAAPAALQFPQWQSGNELLGPYFAGFMEGAGSTAANIDGGEIYTLRSASEFDASYGWRKNDLASSAVNCAFIPAALRAEWPGRSSISFGVYDVPFGGAGMDPTILRSTIANSLRRADRYVWFYSEAATYLLPPILGGASDAWVSALRQGKADAAAAGSGTPPASPTTLASQSASASAIDLTWVDGSSDETGFEVERKIGAAGTWSRVSTPVMNATSIRDSGLTSSTAYTYRLRAVNGAGNSGYTNETSSTTAASAIPTAPANLSAQAVSSTTIDLAWEDRSSNENGFSIERLNGSTWGQIAWVADNITMYRNTGLNPGTSYSYRVLAFNGSGNSTTTNQVTISTPAASQIPAAPSNLAGTADSSTSVTLTWSDGSSNENGFSIERRNGSTWSQVGWVAANVTTYRNTGLTAGTAYSYRVLAFNGYGNSATTNEATVTTTAASQIPAAPSGLSGSADSATSVALSWTDGSSNENGFSIERRNGSTWSQVGWVAANITTYRNTGLTAGASYSYRVLAFNGYGNSPTTNEVSVTTPSQIPAAPSNLSGLADSSTSVTLSWADNSSNENGFSIERKSGTSWRQVGWVGANIRSFRQTGLVSGVTYKYRVLAFNGAGNSATSNQVSVRTP